ncbi:histidine phosphatase family protein [Virgibacillus soli]|uniref:histidine phosphatase family protein n=1 Tax=Paracerasibacillus soli TaxID=480284 RepID=UPI0035EC7ED7
MKTNIYFVRHAHATFIPNQEKTRPLSRRGKKDSIKITETLSSASIDFVISSPYLRAIQTVEGVAHKFGKEIILNKHFKERTLASESVSDFQQAIYKVWEDPNFSWPGGESNVAAQTRSVTALLETLKTYQGSNIVIRTHGNIMVLMMSYFNSTYGFDFWLQLQMPDIYKCTFIGTKLVSVQHIPLELGQQ